MPSRPVMRPYFLAFAILVGGFPAFRAHVAEDSRRGTAPPRTRKHVVVKRPDGNRIRVSSNKDVDTGYAAVKDGTLAANGKQTPWSHRCVGLLVGAAGFEPTTPSPPD